MSPANGTQARSSSHRPLDQRLLAYALGGGALALVATPAEATPISSGLQNISVASLGPTANPQAKTTVLLNPNDATSPSFTFGWGYQTGQGGYVITSSVVGNSNQAGYFGFYDAGFASGRNFAAGQVVGAAVANPKYPKYMSGGLEALYGSSGSWLSSDDSSGLTATSNWSAGGSGYLGFQYLDGALAPHYGWMQINVPTTSAAGQNATLVQWAWESAANTSITIPAISPAAVPEIDPASGASAAALVLGGLSLLEQQLGFAAGAAGLRAWRKRRLALAA